MLLSGYKELTLQKSGIKSAHTLACWGAYFILDTDISGVFPYINAVVPKARYYDYPEYIQFLFEQNLCTLYPSELIVAPFPGREQAEAYFLLLADFLNDLQVKRDTLRPNHRRYRPAAILDIVKRLPNTNCGKCGYPTCIAFSAALRRAEVQPGVCPGFPKPAYQQAVYHQYDQDGRITSTMILETDDTIHRPLLNKDSSSSNGTRHETQTNGTGKNPCSDLSSDGTYGPLTKREIEVLRLLSEGSTNTDISEQLSISPHTVKSHVIHIFNKLGVNDRTQASVRAVQKKLI
jgi:DNA-binding CsgD family transcriptional regulator/ArsR family metal-binding transcriptional regulator